MTRRDNIGNRVDWFTILLYFLLVVAGWLNIYAAVYDETAAASIFSLSVNSGRQLIWIGISIVVMIVILVIDLKFYDSFAWIFYGAMIFSLLYVMVFARDISGAKSWIEIGGARLQPSEFAKFTTALVIAKVLRDSSIRIDRQNILLQLVLVIGLPMGLIVLQGDTGTALVFTSFIIVLYREGLSPIPILLGIAAAIIFILTLLVPNHWFLYVPIVVLAGVLILVGQKTVKRISLILAGALVISATIVSVDYIFENVLKPHQQNRLRALLNPDADPLGYGWNITQSKIAIGSGGPWGKGFLNGTQTKFDFVPEQSTDFIFCTIGEEHGWLGSFLLIALFLTLIVRVVFLSERQKWRFARVYGYCVASILFFHFAVNIGMTIGLFPVIGIPLPFFSYGGSSLIGFTILLFILLKLDAHRMELLIR